MVRWRIPLFIGLLLSLALWAARSPVGAVAPPVAPRTITNSLGMKFVRIPAGTFLMGSPASEEYHWGNEPLRRVTLTRTYYLQTTEVTQKDYARIMKTNPSHFSPTGKGKASVKGLDTSRFPVDFVSWFDAKRFCERLSALPAEKKAGRRYRLPTEAEWARACRGGVQQSQPFSFGPTLTAHQANIVGTTPYGKAKKSPSLGRTTTVASYPANQFGLYDMHGNVGEWCADWYDDTPPGSPDRAVVNPMGPKAGEDKVIRGGACLAAAHSARSASRAYAPPHFRAGYIGFRVVLEFSPNKVP
jgi:formylglycine-generating enzyme required for sulfatase activity